ncbi:MAG TPA: NAD(P)-dependent alcohol dehydrogenase [Microthrixaceae bacterium]|nr:NAD(P)-dependent alcohol dehydrogenase [Microthrixaceae bacterium]
MDAVQLTEWKHDPEVRDVEQPDPAPGQVLVRVAGAGMCHSDLHLIHDFESGMVPFEPPFTLGHENAGWVEAVGAGVVGLELGQPVAVYGPTGCGRCHRCVQGMQNYCEHQDELTSMAAGLGDDGGMAQFMLVRDARHLVPLGDLDPVEAAPLTDAGLTPYHAVKRSADLLVAGSTALVIGVGGLGHLGVQILEALTPATVIAVDTRTSALELAATAGAEHTVRAGDDAAAEIADLTGGKNADVVLDFVGSDSTIQLAVAAGRSLGHITVVGIAGGSYPFSFFTVPYEASLATTYWGSIPELMEVLHLAERGLIRAEVERISIDEAPDGYRRLARGEVDGRLVVIPG